MQRNRASRVGILVEPAPVRSGFMARGMIKEDTVRVTGQGGQGAWHGSHMPSVVLNAIIFDVHVVDGNERGDLTICLTDAERRIPHIPHLYRFIAWTVMKIFAHAQQSIQFVTPTHLCRCVLNT